MSQFLYNCYIFFLGLGLYVASFFSLKAKRWRSDRKNQHLSFPDSDLRAWFHVSSLGELEQAYPLIESVKRRNYSIIVSFFSHSGYDYASRYTAIDYSFLLPIDKKSKAKTLVRNINPKIVFWTKNDFWLNTMDAVIAHKCGIVMFSAVFYKNHIIAKPGFGIFRKILSKLDHIFVQDEHSRLLLAKNNINNVSVSGDTRISRVKRRSENPKLIDGLSEFCQDKEVLVLASVHQEDQSIIRQSISNFNQNFKIIIVPHDISDKNIEKLMLPFQKEKYSIGTSFENVERDIFVYNKMGLLFDIYHLADIVYIGGGFGKGIHNILEPTVFGASVIFGPDHKKFGEALKLLKLGLVKDCKTTEDFTNIVKSLNHKLRAEISDALLSFYNNYPDSIEIIIKYCLSKKLIN